MPRVVYRIVLHDPPTDVDYLTYEQQGRAVDIDNDEALRMSKGLSIYLSLAVARKRAKGLPWKGQAFIAEYVLPDEDDRIVIEQTGVRRSHYTVWCDASILQRALSRVVPVKEDQGDI
ncbi:MAG TPA: hypothetical protein VNZ58_01245 [Thermomicrobiales bacterium]|nr:hypothetical protein [Thermomicrobiales bacterium]